MKSRRNPTLSTSRIRVGITMGDPSGIGPEIIAKALPQIKNLAEFIIIGDWWTFDKSTNVIASPERAKQSNKKIASPLSLLAMTQTLPRAELLQKFVDLKNVKHKKFKFGQIRAEYGKASIEYIDKALELLKNKEIDCLVTCPISKEAVNLSGLKFSGHTEYLANKTQTKDFVMMLLNDKLKFSLITQHIPIYKVSSGITTDKLKKTLRLTYQELKKLFRIKRPKIAVCGLNPHASDNGVIGDEEKKIIAPGIKKLRYCHGPIPADIAIAQAFQGKFDAVIAMYHDQALIPLKLTSKETGVNLTLGLPFVRTSPLHGTAFDIAGKNIACPDSLISAVKLALQCTQNL